MKFERYGIGIAKGMAVTFRHLFRKPVTTQYPEERLTVSRRTRGNELIWNQEQCSGCTTCAQSCPQGAIEIVTSGNGVVTAPCSQACPAGVNAQGYIALISQGKFKEALEVIRRTMPFAGVCGRVCLRPCEKECKRGKVDEPVSIRSLKRFTADYELRVGRGKAIPVKKSRKDKVAIIGSGPAGLACAYDLVRQGYPVTVFEAAPQAGGLLRYGIPEYRLPNKILDNEISYIEELGVDIKTNTPVTNLGNIFNKGYKAIFLGNGAWMGQKMGIPNEDAKGVIHALNFLKKANSGEKVELGDRVAVIGGGNAAIDAARVATRLGAEEVSLIYRRTRAEMPANPEEIEGALAEGVKIHFLAAPVKVLTKDDRVTGIQCIQMELGEPDASGRRRPIPIKDSEFNIDANTVIIAIGQAVDKTMLPKELEYTSWGTLSVDPATLQTNIEGVFAGGDVVSGPSDVIASIAVAKEAAISIDKYLGGEGIIEETLAPPEAGATPLKKTREGWRPQIPVLPLGQRVSSFAEVELGLSEEMAVKEAKRCLKCDLAYGVDKFEVDIGYCIFCGLCVEACPRNALFMGYGYERARYRRGELVMAKEDLLLSDEKQPSGYARPEVEAALPQQTLLLDRAEYLDKVKKRWDLRLPFGL